MTSEISSLDETRFRRELEEIRWVDRVVIAGKEMVASVILPAADAERVRNNLQRYFQIHSTTLQSDAPAQGIAGPRATVVVERESFASLKNQTTVKVISVERG